MPITELPLPSEPIDIETRKSVVISKSGNGTMVALRKSKPFRYPVLSFTNRDQSEKDDVADFWKAHYPKTSFTWGNDDAGISDQPFLFDSILRTQPAGYDLWSYFVTLKAVNPLAYSAVGNDLPATPDWGHEVQFGKEFLASDAISQGRKAEAISLTRRGFRLGFQDRLLSEFLTIENFWAYYYPGKVLNLNADLTGNGLHVDGNFKIVSNLKWSVTALVVSSCEFEIMEV
jgi:hypothetical protein